ncbi:hypothetical protein FKP32DRAFT_1578835 [Trametes sanguinea]|nr:hypothetical protein FKP32DRAFT_1578835 [Trametes sanguinea]
MVHDPHNATHQPKAVLEREGGLSEPIKYVRLFPEPRRNKVKDETLDDARVGQLHFSEDNRFGMGNHSYVYRTPLTLPPPLSAHSHDGRVTVAAKLAYSQCSAHNLLRNEGRVYNLFPKHIQQEYCGYNIVPQCRFPVPATAIVPKFYGYYVPVDEDGNMQDRHHDNCDETDPCRVDWPSPILLMEECGNPVEPDTFTIDQRTECFSLIQRLHHMDLTQGSFYVRNIMIQPGPLTAPPAERSYDTPSFRIIDFGRGDDWDTYSRRRYSGGRRGLEWQARLGDEIARARNELLIDDFGF